VLGVNAEVEAVIDGRWSYHDGLDEHEHDDFESITVDIQMADDPALISDRAQRTLAIEGVLRIKGVAAIANKNARLVVQGVGARLDHYYDRPWNPDEERAGRLVVIGLNGFDTALAAEILQG
ncbi:MAG: cobalamin biosynthesis protein CobW, partial [Rhodospirillaceae bacterium]|nr:cobalamin biosynthesis protein CobW [Rhodospirillaceae bacterium]